MVCQASSDAFDDGHFSLSLTGSRAGAAQVLILYYPKFLGHSYRPFMYNNNNGSSSSSGSGALNLTLNALDSLEAGRLLCINQKKERKREKESKWAAVDGTREKFLITKERRKKKPKPLYSHCSECFFFFLFIISRHPPLVSFSATVFIIYSLLTLYILIETLGVWTLVGRSVECIRLWRVV